MSYYEKISCRIAIQVCVGYSSNGRKKHRTFSMRGIEPAASFDAIANVIRALAPVLIYPITKVTKVTKREIIFYEDAVMPIPKDNVAMTPKTRRVISFPVPKRLPARKICNIRRPIVSPGLPTRQVDYFSGRAPPESAKYWSYYQSDVLVVFAAYESASFRSLISTFSSIASNSGMLSVAVCHIVSKLTEI